MRIELLEDVKLHGTHFKCGEIIEVVQEDGLRLCRLGVAADTSGVVPTGKLNGVTLTVQNGRIGARSLI